MLRLGPKLKKLKRINLNFLPGFSNKYFIKNNLTKFNKAFDSYYLMELLEKQKLKYNFYLKENFIKKYLLLLKKHKYKKYTLLYIINLRLDTFLFNIGFSTTILESRHWIVYKHILVNFNIIKNPSYILKKGDIIHINPKSILIIKKCKNNILLRYYILQNKFNILGVNLCLKTLKCKLIYIKDIKFNFIKFKFLLIKKYYTY